MQPQPSEPGPLVHPPLRILRRVVSDSQESQGPRARWAVQPLLLLLPQRRLRARLPQHGAQLQQLYLRHGLQDKVSSSSQLLGQPLSHQ